jgi:hypothetical protein
MIAWNPDLLEKHIAPEIAEFTEANMTNLESEFDQHKHWLNNHFLNNALRSSFKPKFKQFALNFIFRAQTSFRLYHQAIKSTEEYLSSNNIDNPNIGKYYEAISIWETVLLNWAVAFDVFKKFNSDEKIFESNDGSEEERAYFMHNEIKHCGGNIFGESFGLEDNWTETSTIPIWLTNSGIKSHRKFLGYSDISNLIKELAIFADKLQDPSNFAVLQD